MNALEKANKVRTRRAQLKRDIKAGQESVARLLLNPPMWLETMKIYDLLLALPKYGRVKSNKVLVQCRISPSKTIGGLSERQRTEVVSMIGYGRAPARPMPAPTPAPAKSTVSPDLMGALSEAQEVAESGVAATRVLPGVPQREDRVKQGPTRARFHQAHSATQIA
jgi:hypothetical protein